MERPSTDVYMMGMAMMAASRGSCARRAVGCVLTSEHNHILATGYNGPPKGMAHCSQALCPGRNAASGTFLDGCRATHAEQNALLQCGDVMKIQTVYTTTQPCFPCTKLLLNTSAEVIVYMHSYPHPMAEEMWRDSGRSMLRISTDELQQVHELFQIMSERSKNALTMSRRG